MTKPHQHLLTALAFCALSLIAGCGGSGGDSDNTQGATDTNPFNIDSYAEYQEGDDLSGIWMMVVNTQFDYETDDGETRQGTTAARTTLFVKEDANANLSISNPFCSHASFNPTNLEFSGSTMTLSTASAVFNLNVESNSRISGEIAPPDTFTVSCDGGNDCQIPSNITAMSSSAELVKIAPLPDPDANLYFGADNRPVVGNVTTQLPGSNPLGSLMLGFEPITCFAQVIATGQRILHVYSFEESHNDYEEIIVNHQDSLLYAEKSQPSVLIQNFLAGAPTPTQNFYTNRFDYGSILTDGSNPSTITLDLDSSSDGSSDASSDQPAIEINLDI